MTAPRWQEVAGFSSGFEADLEVAGIDAVRDDNDTGIFGPGFQGAIPRGVTVHVLSPTLDEARAILPPATDTTTELPRTGSHQRGSCDD